MFDKTKRGKVSIISLFITTDFRSVTFYSGPLLIFIGSKALSHQIIKLAHQVLKVVFEYHTN